MKKSGFTLVETVVGLAVLIFILFALFGLYLQFVKFFGAGDTQFSTVGVTRTALNGFAPYVLQGHRVLATSTVNGTAYASNATTSILQLPSIDSNGDTLNNTWDYVVFYQNGTNFYRVISSNGASSRASATSLLTRSLSNLKFTYDQADFTAVKNITIDVASTLKANHASSTSHVTEQVRLRNY